MRNEIKRRVAVLENQSPVVSESSTLTLAQKKRKILLMVLDLKGELSDNEELEFERLKSLDVDYQPTRIIEKEKEIREKLLERVKRLKRESEKGK